MPSIAKYRRTYFALLKKLGIREEDRHAVNQGMVGKESTKDWTEKDWRQAISTLQYEAGQKDSKSGPPLVRDDSCGDVAAEPGRWATERQARFVQDLCRQIDWSELQRGPVGLLLTTILKADEKALRRAQVNRIVERSQEEEDAELSMFAVTSTLSRQEAAVFIDVLKKIRGKHKRERAG